MSKKAKVIAVVGSGGKTTYIKHKAQENVATGNNVFVTTTTHMYVEEDTALTNEVDLLIQELESKGYLMTGVRDGGKIKELPKEIYDRVCNHADIVLVEADGSKHLPIKFPAEHEPVIPENVDEIVVVCGLQAIGKPLAEVSHRAELVKKCLRATDDTIINAAHIQKLLREGYLKPMKEKYPEKNIKVKAVHDNTLYQKVISRLLEADMEVSLVKEEWFKTQPTLVICGGGHVSCELVKMASCLDFKVKVIDDREEFANKDRFPTADEVICDSFKNLEKYLVADGYYAVITRGHKDDLTCVRTILKHSYEYLGMIGSKSKINTTYENLKKEGVQEEAIKTIYAPIGLNIGGRTPAEIAVSILAEIIQVKNKKSSSFISREMSAINENGTLCIIVDKKGSSPRGEGSMMFVTDSYTIDSIGGGAVEYAAIEDARNSKKKVFVKEYDLHNRTTENLGMICGGINKVLFIALEKEERVEIE